MASGGKNLRLMSLYELLKEMDAPPEVVENVKTAEETANTTIRVLNMSSGSPMDVESLIVGVSGSEGFDYSTNDGHVTVGERLSAFPLKFSKASNTAIHLYRSVGLTHIARVKGDALPPRISLSEFDSTSRSYKIHIGERFLARNTSGRLLIGRITKIQDDSRGDSKDWVTFKYLYDWDPGDEIDSI
jgi:hypothetical protein